MCSHYQAIKERERYLRHFGVEPPQEMAKEDLWPGYLGTFIRRLAPVKAANDTQASRQALAGLFGLVPRWAADPTITRHTFNARSESVASKPSFREAWKRSQHCIIPVEAFFESDWRTGKSIPTRIERADGAPLGLAGLWSLWKSAKGDEVFSYTLLTLNAQEHPLMRLFHKPTDEKRMVVILPEDHYDGWLSATPEHSHSFLHHYPAQLLRATPAAANHGVVSL